MKVSTLILCIAAVFSAVAPALAKHEMIVVRPNEAGNIVGAAVIAAAPIHGVPTVTSPATLTVDGLNVRLLGVRPPGEGMLCRDPDGTDHKCISVAIHELRDLIAEKPVRCEVRTGHDENGLPLATCFAADGQNLNAWIIRHGYGLTDGTRQYEFHSQLAEAEGAGLWLFVLQPEYSLIWNLVDIDELQKMPKWQREAALHALSQQAENLLQEFRLDSSQRIDPLKPPSTEPIEDGQIDK